MIFTLNHTSLDFFSTCPKFFLRETHHVSVLLPCQKQKKNPKVVSEETGENVLVKCSQDDAFL